MASNIVHYRREVAAGLAITSETRERYSIPRTNSRVNERVIIERDNSLESFEYGLMIGVGIEWELYTIVTKISFELPVLDRTRRRVQKNLGKLLRLHRD